MFCNQCEQTAKGQGCTVMGVCGKKEDVARLQDAIVYALRRMAYSVLNLHNQGVATPEADDLTSAALFATLTNTNFDAAALENILRDIVLRQNQLDPSMACQADSCTQTVDAALVLLKQDAPGLNELNKDPDIRSAMQTLLFGCKGVAAYRYHAAILGKRDPVVDDFLYTALVAGIPVQYFETQWEGVPDHYSSAGDALGRERSLEEWLDLIMLCGKTNLRAMELLEEGNTEAFGTPQPTSVSLGHRKGKAIVVSGHDLRDLHDLLEQTRDTGINIYTHGEMLPAHGYPKLHAYPHLAGHFGTAWQNQQRQLPDFPGPALFTTNCIQNPQGYDDKVFTSGVTGWPGRIHFSTQDYSELIRMAQSMPGYPDNAFGGEVTTGFGRKTLLAAVPKLLEAIRSGQVRHIFLVGGCDGARPGRNYYTEFVEQAPSDTLILTLACGKFRFFDKKLGTAGGLPRLMDVGQCNDAYAAVQLVLALADALKTDVNSLPLSLVLSWYEQKAVAVLLTLLALGVKNIRLGPTQPAFLSPTLRTILSERLGLQPITTPDEDLKTLLA